MLPLFGLSVAEAAGGVSLLALGVTVLTRQLAAPLAARDSLPPEVTGVLQAMAVLVMGLAVLVMWLAVLSVSGTWLGSRTLLKIFLWETLTLLVLLGLLAVGERQLVVRPSSSTSRPR